MKRIFFSIVAMIVGATSIAQEVVYDANAEVRNVGSFSAIEVSGTISLYLSQGSETGVAVSAGEEKYNSKIKTEVKNGVLKISVDAGMWNGFSWTNKKLKAYVSVANLNRLEVTGASYASINGVLKANVLKLDVSGASEIKGNLDVQNLNIDMSGASVTRLSGSASTVSIDASGAAKMNGFDLKTESAKVDASGASHVTISANKEFNANASGGSSIQYRGNATVRNVNSSSGASIKRKNSNDD